MKIKIACEGSGVLKLDELVNLQGELKRLTAKNKSKLKKSILKYGFSAPIFIWENEGKNYILDGTQRLKVLKGMEAEGYNIPELPVVTIYAKNIEEAKEKLLHITSQYGEFQKDELETYIKELNIDDILESVNIDMLGTIDFNMGTVDDDEVQEEVQPVTKIGDLWELGNHRLLCGDSSKKENIDKLMDGAKADMILTDPPYGINLDTDYTKMKASRHFAEMTGVGRGRKYKRVINDDIDFDPSFILNQFNYCKEIFLFGADNYCWLLPKNGSWIVWDKRANIDTAPDIVERRDKIYTSAFELCWSKRKHKKEIARFMWAGVFGTEKEPNHKRVHPTQKPIRLMEWFFKRYKGKLVVDLFMGSGSTLIAAEKMDRICYGMEIDPHYCDVIVIRYKDWCIKNGKEINIKLNGNPENQVYTG